MLTVTVAAEKHHCTHRSHSPIADGESILLANLPPDEVGPSHTTESGECSVPIRSASVRQIEQNHLVRGSSVVRATPLDP